MSYFARTSALGQRGQEHVGGNVAVSALQRYLCDHPGQSIPLRRGASTVEVVLIDDDALAVTASSRTFRLSDEDLERMHSWIQSNRHDLASEICIDDCQKERSA
ncbi:hypothetical protein [Ktedonobacter racemifer]|uniref:Uncharacterized protein n=1 Tax=Ktedonobacter racemifer DSM 44963 TaxID=485913 RepID=D6TDC6_KTERA|nr:hypothetical protein [Ktedonobacter racemifer]EFH88271.1 hypothetical protein Krac_9693 [Ktedonobacter racemifer DSM 44963]